MDAPKTRWPTVLNEAWWSSKTVIYDVVEVQNPTRNVMGNTPDEYAARQTETLL
jgi:hypothetical protein